MTNQEANIWTLFFTEILWKKNQTLDLLKVLTAELGDTCL